MTAYRVGVGAALLLSAAVAACGGGTRDEEARAEPAPAVATLNAADVAVATRTDLASGLPVSGTLEPKVSFTVGAPLAEQIVEMFVNEGDRVSAGRPLARFKDDVLRAAALSARAEVAALRSAVRMAEAESSRADALFREGAIAARDQETAFVALETARSRFALAEAQLSNAEDQFNSTVVRAPLAGVVSRRHVQAGDRLDNGQAIVDLVDTRILQLTASVPVEWLAQIRPGRPVDLTLAQLDAVRVAGRIARINPTVDAATRQVRVYVDVPNASGRLVGGLFASGRVLVAEAARAVAVPVPALRYEGAERAATVYVVANGKVARRRVTVGVTDEAQSLVEIRSGLEGGETVIIGPVEGLEDGAPIQVTGAAGPAAR